MGACFALVVWCAAGIRTLDPAVEFGVLHVPSAQALQWRTERSLVVAPPGLLTFVRYPRNAVELPLPQAEDAMVQGANGTRFGFRGQATIQIRPEAWRDAAAASSGRGMSGVLLSATKAAGGRLTVASASRGVKRPALARELETVLGEELSARGVDLRRLSFAALDYLAVPVGSRAPPAADTKLLVVGLDGADWAILDPLLQQGRMPNLARLIAKGLRAKLLSISPTLSPVVWTTVATGVEPSRHGILDFLIQDPKSGQGQPVTSVQRRAPTAWDILSRAGVPVGVVGWWATWPADPLHGYLVSDRIAYQLFGYRSDIEQAEGKTWPDDLYSELRPQIVLPDRIAWDQVVPYLSGSRRTRDEFDSEEQKMLDDFRTLLAAGETYLSIALYARRRFAADFEAVYFEGTDTVGHLFMPYRPPQRSGVSARRFQSFSSIVDRYYETADRYLGRLLEDRGEDWTVLVLSDHGFASDATRPLTTDSRIGHGPAADWHRRFGVLVLSGAHVRPGARLEEASVYDIAPTVLALFGQPVPASWPGRVLGDAIEPEFVARYPVRFRQDEPERENLLGEEGLAASDPAAADLREKLTNLGYVGGGDGTQVSVSAFNNTGVALMAEGKYESAVEQFRKGLAEQPRQPNLRVNLGLALRMLGRTGEARTEFERAMEFPGSRRAAGHQLAQIALDSGEYGSAERYLREILEEEPGASEVRNTLGLVLEKESHLARAEAEYRRAAEEDPNAAQPRSNLGNLARARGDLETAESWYRKAIEADPYFMGAYNNLALVYQEEGQLEKAIDLYARALGKAPGNAIVMNNLASLYYARGDMEEARKLWERSIQVDPKYPSPLNNLGGIEIAAQNFAKAEELLQKALTLEPGYGDARINLALIRQAQGRPDEVRAELKKAAGDPRSRVGALTQLGMFELQTGSPESALPLLREVRVRNPRNANLLNALGEACRRLGRREEAAEAWRGSLAIDPGQEEVRRALEALGG